MKITKKTLKRIIAEELKTMLHEADPTQWKGGSSPEKYVPFEGKETISKGDVPEELEKIKATFGISDEELEQALQAEIGKSPQIGKSPIALREDDMVRFLGGMALVMIVMTISNTVERLMKRAKEQPPSEEPPPEGEPPELKEWF